MVGLENFMITRKILPTSFRENLNKNSLIEVFMWCNRDFSANLNTFIISRKKRQKMNFKPFYTHKGFDSKKFPYFKKYLIGRSSIVLKHFLIFMPPYARTREWNIFGWRKKLQSSGVPIRLLTKKTSSVISLKTSWTVCSQLLSDFWWLMWALDRI